MLNASFFLRCRLPEKDEKGFLASLGDGLSSLRLTIALLILLAVASIFGTVIPQNASPEEYLRFWKPSTYRILSILGFLDLYHASWFFLLLALLCLNLITCSWRRFRATWKLLTLPARQMNEGQLKSLPQNGTFSKPGSPGQFLPQFQVTLARIFKKPTLLESPGSYLLFAEKEKFSRLGVYGIHLSVLVILAGSLFGSYFGFRGDVNIVEGERANRVILRGKGRVQPLGFAVRLEKFDVSFYPTGAPKEFKSTLTILEGDRAVITEPIRVNHPLTYKGISFYQANYGISDVEEAVLAIKDRETGKTANLPAKLGTRTEIPGSSAAFQLTRFLPDLQGMGPALQVSLLQPGGSHENFWILASHPEWSEKRPGRYQFTVLEIHPRYYSGLQVTKDPGVWVVWGGCFLMMIGFYLTFFMSHRRVWVRLTEKRGATLVEVGGSSHRDRAGFEKEFERLKEALKEGKA